MKQRNLIAELKMQYTEIQNQYDKIKAEIEAKDRSIERKNRLLEEEKAKYAKEEKWKTFIEELVKEELKSQDNRDQAKDPSPAEINQILQN